MRTHGELPNWAIAMGFTIWTLAVANVAAQIAHSEARDTMSQSCPGGTMRWGHSDASVYECHTLTPAEAQDLFDSVPRDTTTGDIVL